jgi:putative heme-binding domain-containing protein
LKGVDVGALVGNGSLYRVKPLDGACEAILMGEIPGKEAEPVAWTREYGGKKARVFYTSLGHPGDFAEPAFVRLLLNGMGWAMGRQIVANVDPPAATAAPKLIRSKAAPELNVAEGLRLDAVLREPQITKPLYINFDERGRMWVVQYRQYPWPAGLKLISRDAVWRNVYEPAFPPPPPYEGENAKFQGKDLITIHESTRGDGVFDKTTVFLEGMNLTTAALKGRGGVYVMNTPYLLFYPCRNGADRPDTDKPEVLLSGFGLEDTHSVANSLRWGPDGWIYGAQGSTVGSAIVRHGADGKPVPGEKPVHIMGQNIWRYHPETRRFEIFAEGGGNTFGVVFDDKGRVYSGHNGGDTRGFHYVQGGYYLKGFEKHGALSNPYAFGYIQPMKHAKVDRFTHTFSIYEGGALPKEYEGKLIAVAPHRHYVIESELVRLGSTFRTEDVGKIVTPGDAAEDDFFTPVDIQIGPDGGLYIADWRAQQANHYRSSEGKTNPELGRIYRLTGKDAPAAGTFDLGKLSSEELARRYLGHNNRWFREQVLRLLGDRKDASLAPVLKTLVRENTGQFALEAFWGVNLCGGFDEAFAAETLSHKDPYVRAWAVRLIGDNNSAAPALASKLAGMAKSEADVEVRSQLACTAKRLPTGQALAIVAGLLGHDEDAADVHIPKMIWWAVEAHANDRGAILKMYEDRGSWASKLRPDGSAVSENVMRRWAMAGTQEDLLACAKLMNLAPDKEATIRLVAGFERAFEGRPVPALPDALAEALARVGGEFATLLGVRRGDAGAIDQAIAGIGDAKKKPADRVRLIRAVGDVRAEPPQAVPLLLRIAGAGGDETLRTAALSALQKYGNAAIGGEVVKMYGGLPGNVQTAAQTLLASRIEWARSMLKAIDTGEIKARSVEPGTVDKLRLYEEGDVKRLVGTHFPGTPSTAAELEEKIGRMARVIRSGGGQPMAGKQLFYGRVGCANCHTVFNKGGHIGPDLTSYDRANLDSMLLAVVNPSAEIREGFENYLIVTKDGRTLDGFKVDEDGKVFVLRGIDGQNNVIPMDQIRTRKVSPKSLMPEGLLDGLSDQELKDLFAFLKSTTPPM